MVLCWVTVGEVVHDCSQATESSLVELARQGRLYVLSLLSMFDLCVCHWTLFTSVQHVQLLLRTHRIEMREQWSECRSLQWPRVERDLHAKIQPRFMHSSD